MLPCGIDSSFFHVIIVNQHRGVENALAHRMMLHELFESFDEGTAYGPQHASYHCSKAYFFANV